MREVTAQRFGCWHGALLIVSLVATTGCLLYRGDRQPNLIATGARATAPDAPRIEVVLHHRHTIDGKDAGGQATELTFKQMKSSWERVQKETPFLANAGSGIAKADFTVTGNKRALQAAGNLTGDGIKYGSNGALAMSSDFTAKIAEPQCSKIATIDGYGAGIGVVEAKN